MRKNIAWCSKRSVIARGEDWSRESSYSATPISYLRHFGLPDDKFLEPFKFKCIYRFYPRFFYFFLFFFLWIGNQYYYWLNNKSTNKVPQRQKTQSEQNKPYYNKPKPTKRLVLNQYSIIYIPNDERREQKIEMKRHAQHIVRIEN